MPHFPEIVDTYTEGDTLPVFARTFSGGDITGWTITLYMRRADCTLLTKTATITDGPNGAYQFAFAATDLIPGQFQGAEIELDDTAGGIQTVGPILFNVRQSTQNA